MREIQAPNPVPEGERLLFLAGSIEMGRAHEWQREVMRLLSKTSWTILNPRRGSWDTSWEQSADHQAFRQQVEWELEALERSEKILLYFDPGTRSPVSLLELGLFARGGKLIVVCPEGFWRKGNVEIVCERYGIIRMENLEAAVGLLQGMDRTHIGRSASCEE